MSLTAFKRKSVINYGSKRSGTAPGGYWLPQGPFGTATVSLKNALRSPNNSGFSINGGRRNIGGVGRDMKMSKSGTPYRGTQPVGFGGTQGRYPSATLVGPYSGALPNAQSKEAPVQPVLNSAVVDTLGTQYMYIKPSSLSTKGMLEKKYRWAYTRGYPYFWVQPVYTGNQTDSASQGLYIQNLSSQNNCNLKVNNVGAYEDNIIRCGPTLCTPGRSTARFKYNDMARNAPYTKTLYQPVTYGQYNLRLTRKCLNPVGAQKEFPYRTNTGSSLMAAGTSITSVASGCGSGITYVAPPEWYIQSGPQNPDPVSTLDIPQQSAIICGRV